MAGLQIGDRVMDDPPWDTKSVYDMAFNEVDNVCSFNFNEWYNSTYIEK